MTSSLKTKARARYDRRLLLWSAIYAATLLGTMALLKREHFGQSLTVFLSVLPAIPIVAIVAIAGLYLKEETDEFQRDFFIQTLLWGIGFTLVVTSVWGLLEMFTPVHHLSPMRVFLLFWASSGLANLPLHLRYRSAAHD